MSTAGTAATAKVTFGQVFAEREYRVLWAAQIVSIAGDQFARVAIAVLVYGRTRSALLAAVSFAVTALADTAGGLGVAWVADRWPLRRVMITCDVTCLGLVLVMAVPGLPLGVLIGLLFMVGLAFQPFLAARMKVNLRVLGPERFSRGAAITISTYQLGQLGGFAAGGVVAAVAGTRPALLIDAASFGVSAMLIRFGLGPQPAARRNKPGLRACIRVIFGRPGPRTALLMLWMAAFFAVAEGIAVPLAHQLGGGAITAGWLLAGTTAGAAAGPQIWTGLVKEAAQMRFAAVMPLAGSTVLLLFALPPLFATALAIVVVSGLFTGYFATADLVLFGDLPEEYQGKASGLTGAGMSLGQGVMMIAAGALAQRISPALVIAACGAAGVAAAVPLMLAWRRVQPAR